VFKLDELMPYIDCSERNFKQNDLFKFVAHKHKNVADTLYKDLAECIYGSVP